MNNIILNDYLSSNDIVMHVTSSGIFFEIVLFAVGLYLGFTNKAIFYLNNFDMILSFFPFAGLVLCAISLTIFALPTLFYLILTTSILVFMYNCYNCFNSNNYNFAIGIPVLAAKSLLPLFFIFVLFPSKNENDEDMSSMCKNFALLSLLSYTILRLVNGAIVNAESFASQRSDTCVSSTGTDHCTKCKMNVAKDVLSFRLNEIMLCSDCYNELRRASQHSNSVPCSKCGRLLVFEEAIECGGNFFCHDCYNTSSNKRYEILLKYFNIKHGFSLEQLKLSYKQLVAINHPDKVDHMSDDIKETARKKTIEINGNYEELRGYL